MRKLKTERNPHLALPWHMSTLEQRAVCVCLGMLVYLTGPSVHGLKREQMTLPAFEEVGRACQVTKWDGSRSPLSLGWALHSKLALQASSLEHCTGSGTRVGAGKWHYTL